MKNYGVDALSRNKWISILTILFGLIIPFNSCTESENPEGEKPYTWGRLELSGPEQVKAGSYQTYRITYHVGEFGIDDLAGLRLLLRTLTDCGHLQTDHPDKPNYMTGTTTGEAKVKLKFLTHSDPGGGIRPWETAIAVQIHSGYLKEGDSIEIVLGDRSKGSPGWRMQTFCEPTYEIRCEVNPFGTGIFEPLEDRLIFSIVPDDPVQAVAVAPSVVQKGESFSIRVRSEDKFGNPLDNAKDVRHEGFTSAGIYRLDVQDPDTRIACMTNPIIVEESMPDYSLFWGDLHAQSEETVGTNSLKDYLEFAKNKACLSVFSNQGHGYQIPEKMWADMERLMQEYNEPGKFVTFPGYEWSGNTAMGGDHNVFFKREGYKISRSSRTLLKDEDCELPDSPTIEDLYKTYQGDDDVMIFAHAGGRWADIRRGDKDLADAIEVHSNWGTFEWLLADAFSRNMRVGVVADSDDFRGRPGASYPASDWAGGYGGLTGVFARKLGRESVWEAYKSRRCYATTGARIYLEVLMNEQFHMGEVIDQAKAGSLSVRVSGTAPIERIEVKNGMNVVHTFRPSDKVGGNRIKLLWNGASSRGRARKFAWDGNLKISGNSIREHTLVNFFGFQRMRFNRNGNEANWQSTTTGGNAGVILDLEDKNFGNIVVNTTAVSFEIPVKDIGLDEKTINVETGLETWFKIYRLPEEGVYDYQFEWKVDGLEKGDNPIYVHVVQEDGHRCWSSPIYVVKE